MTRILVVEDELRIASFLVKGLRAAGFEVVAVDDGAQAVRLARDDTTDLVLLDIGLPGKDGITVLREIRAAGQALPVLLLTARDAVPDRVAGLNAGADDYVVKPFSFEELLARIRARLRDSTPPVVRVGSRTLDLVARTVHSGERTVELTTQEFALAEAFFRAPGQVLGREQLLRDVWGIEHDPGSNLVDVYVGYLRKKLGREVVQTVRGAGYRLPG